MAMLTINLLPPERRKGNRKPLKNLLPAAAAAFVVLLSGAGFGYAHFVLLADARDARDEAQSEVQSRKASQQYAKQLKAEAADYEARASTVAEVASARVLWTKKFDELTEVVSEDGRGSRFMVWLSGLDVKPSKSSGRSPRRGQRGAAPMGPTVTLEGVAFAERDPLQRYNVFHSDLSESRFFGDFASMSNPAGEVVDYDDGFEPRRAWKVDLVLQMKGPQPAAAKPNRTRNLGN